MNSRLARAGILVIGALVLTAAFADLLASDKPILAHDGTRLFILPAWTKPSELRDDNVSSFVRRVRDHGGWAVAPIVPKGPNETNLDEALQRPSGRHPFGTDEVGRDVFARVVHGTRISLLVGVASVLLYTLLGVLLGLLAGFYGGRVDAVISRVSETLLSFPTLFLVLTVMGLTRVKTVIPILLVLGLTRWPDVARLVRAEVLRLRTLDFVQASRALGASDLRLLLRHLMPHALPPVLVAAAFGVPSAILIESALSFLGFGVPPPSPSWGELLTQAHRYVTYPGAWWLTLFPGVSLFVTVAAFQLLGEGLRGKRSPMSHS